MDKKTYIEIYKKIKSKVHQLEIDNKNTCDETFFKMISILLNHILDIFNNGIEDIPISKIVINNQRKCTYILFYLTGVSDLDNLAYWNKYINGIIYRYPTAVTDLLDALKFGAATVDTWSNEQNKISNNEYILIPEIYDIFTVKKKKLLLFKVKNKKPQLITILGNDGIQLVRDSLKGKIQNE